MNRIIYLDIIRVVAIVCVVILHSASTFLYQFNSIPVNNWQIANIYDSAVRMSVPLFFMISGVLFLKMKNESLKVFFKKRFIKIFLSLMAWSFIYILFRKYILNENVNIIKDFILSIIRKEYYHLWFIYTLLGIYLFIPILKIIVKNSPRELLYYYVVLFFISNAIFPIFTDLLHFDIPNYLLMMQGFSGYLVLGYLLSSFTIRKKHFIFAIIIFILATIFTIYGTYYLTNLHGSFNDFFYRYTSISTIFQSVGIFVVIKYIGEKYRDNIQKTFLYTLISILSLSSFGIYLIHPIIMWFLEHKIFKSLEIHTLLYIPLLAILTFGLSFITIYLMKKIKLLQWMVP